MDSTLNWLLIVCLVIVVITNLMALSRRGSQQEIRLFRLERKIDALLKKLEVNPDAGVDPDVLALAKTGRKIEAIKTLRDRTGLGLKDAKDYVERL
jgi:hypothetical protein